MIVRCQLDCAAMCTAATFGQRRLSVSLELTGSDHSIMGMKSQAVESPVPRVKQPFRINGAEQLVLAVAAVKVRDHECY